jgi:hypothetical protein
MHPLTVTVNEAKVFLLRFLAKKPVEVILGQQLDQLLDLAAGILIARMVYQSTGNNLGVGMLGCAEPGFSVLDLCPYRINLRHQRPMQEQEDLASLKVRVWSKNANVV